MRKFAHPVWKLSLLLFVATAVPAMAQQDQGTKTAGEAFKNIQILKDIPASQLMQVMKNFKTALGVKCDFCHVQGAFEKDDKPQKQTARQMILMARGINKDNFGGERRVTCWTCHRGSAEPESKPPDTQK